MYLAAALLAVLLVVAAIIVWQHATKSTPGETTFGVQDAVEFILPRLEEGIRERLQQSGVQRIVEWEIFYLQGLAQEDRRKPVVTVAGNYLPAVEFIQSEIARRHGASYSDEDIAAVLREQAAYLNAIGAVGEEVGGDDL